MDFLGLSWFSVVVVVVLVLFFAVFVSEIGSHYVVQIG